MTNIGEIDMAAIEAVAEIVGLRDIELFISQIGRLRSFDAQDRE